jgi:hypothetical protein
MAGPCEKAAEVLVTSLLKDMPNVPIKSYMEQRLSDKFVEQFKSMKDNFLVEVIPKISDIQETMKKVIGERKGEINYGTAMLMYYAAACNAGKDDVEKFLVAYGKTEKEILAKHISAPANARLVEQKKLSAIEVALLMPEAVSETTFRAFSTELSRYRSGKTAEGERPDVLYKTGTGG